MADKSSTDKPSEAQPSATSLGQAEKVVKMAGQPTSDANGSIQLFGAIPKQSGASEADLWGRVPKRDWIKYCTGEYARLDVSAAAAGTLTQFHFPRIPKPAVIFVIQWIGAGGKDSAAPGAVKYPRGDLRNIVLLHEMAKDLGIKALIDRTVADMAIGNSKLRSLPFAATTARGAAAAASSKAAVLPTASGVGAATVQPNTLTTIVNTRRARYPRAPPAVLITRLPLEIVAEDADGTWIIHTDGHLVPWRGGIKDEAFAGTVNVTGIIVPHTADAPPPPPPTTTETLELVARWKGGFWKVVATPEKLAREISRAAVKERGHMGALGRILKEGSLDEQRGREREKKG